MTLTDEPLRMTREQLDGWVTAMWREAGGLCAEEAIRLMDERDAAREALGCWLRFFAALSPDHLAMNPTEHVRFHAAIAASRAAQEAHP